MKRKGTRSVKVLITAVIIYGGDFDKKLFEKAKKSVSWCDQLVLVNGVGGNFSDWRNEGLKNAKGDWIFYLDFDEEVTADLRKEIEFVTSKPQTINVAYAIPRRNYIFKKEFKHGGQYPDYQKRLFKRNKITKWVGEVHEEPIIAGKMGHLKNFIIHRKDITISQMIKKTNEWSEIEAELMFKSHHPKMNLFRFASAGFREFVLRFVKQKAFMDGKEGIIYGIYQIYSRLISYSKLWEKQLSTIHT